MRAAVAAGCIFAGVAVIGGFQQAAYGGIHFDSGAERGPLDLRKASVNQKRGTLRFSMATAGRWGVAQLQPRPHFDPAKPQSYLCLQYGQDTRLFRYCMARPDEADRTVMIGGRVNDAGDVHQYDRLPGAKVRRPGPRSAQVFVSYKSAGLKVGRYRWRLRSGWGDASCAPAPEPDPVPPPPKREDTEPEKRGTAELHPCTDVAPNSGSYGARVIMPRRVGCTRDEDMFNAHGPNGKKRIALTFDDGPSSYTSQVISILDRHQVNGTFFVVGENIGGRTSLLRRMMGGGHEIGNHSLHHETNGASSYSLHRTEDLIRGATGFEPCLYRPPGGYISSSTSQTAWQMGMSNILWDVDPQDWRTPGSSAIYSHVVGRARSGSIVLLHDGGGNRSDTVDALDRIIRTLKGRGYQLVTVTKLLRERFRWVP
ncbi:MAG: polysaccharide deacetylase family protein [Solirubrobacterales bacterium]